MSAARETVAAEALRILRDLGFADACERDLMLFGSRYPVAAALPQKYGVDKDESLVYNILKSIAEVKSRLFSDIRLEGGYIDLMLRDEGFLYLQELSFREHPYAGAPADRLTVGCNAGFIHARLLHTANTADAADGLPSSPLARRALWQCMMADSPAGRSVALETTALALDEHRVKNTFRARNAAVMAALVLDRFLL